ncbi:MAG: hypothetical protein EBR38_08405 [Flavobacteriaceae bacterium]|nr:hypothetical protein [Flavobacteriaceae bacterium]
MRLFGASLTRNGAIENSFWDSSSLTSPAIYDENLDEYIDYTGPDIYAEDGGILYHVVFPVEIPQGTGAWFSSLSTTEVDNAGISGTQMGYQNGNTSGVVPNVKYGFDPNWFIPPYTGGYPVGPGDINTAGIWKLLTKVTQRLLFVYNDNPYPVTSTISIADQSLKGIVCEILQYSKDLGYYYSDKFLETFGTDYVNEPGSNGLQQLTKTDGIDYRPEQVKFWLGTFTFDLGNTTIGLNESITMNLGPAGTKSAWGIAVINSYITKSEGSYAAVDDDYMVISTETIPQ